jgi:hypothetical protein
LTIYTIIQQSFEFSPTSLYEIQALGARFLSLVERFEL